MKITAEDFWALLPIALVRLETHFRKTGNRSSLNMTCHRHDPHGQRHQGAERRWIIASRQPGRYGYDPINAVVWLMTGRYVEWHAQARTLLGLDRRFLRRVSDAVYQQPGYSRVVRRKLLDACQLDVRQYLEPTAL